MSPKTTPRILHRYDHGTMADLVRLVDDLDKAQYLLARRVEALERAIANEKAVLA